MNIFSIIRRDFFFYTAVLFVWTVFLFVKFYNYPYFPNPLPSSDFDKYTLSALHQNRMIRSSLNELIGNYSREKDPVERMHICHNIGITYYDLYKADRRTDYLDSAYKYVRRSFESGGDGIARFHYNLGRIFTESGRHDYARAAYEQTIARDPRHILALHNLGLVNYFEFHRAQAAREYLARALAVDTILPMCNLVLGLIELDDKTFTKARDDFEEEIRVDSLFFSGPRKYPVSSQQVIEAVGMARYNLSLLYSTHIRNERKARDQFMNYLAIEKDPQKKKNAISEMSKYWIMSTDAANK